MLLQFGCSHAGAGSYTDEERAKLLQGGSQDLMQSSWLNQTLVCFSLHNEGLRNICLWPS